MEIADFIDNSDPFNEHFSEDNFQCPELPQSSSSTTFVQQAGISNNEKTSFIPKCDEQFIPKVGQKFDNLEDAYNFYLLYGQKSGFDIRRSTERKHRDGTITIKHFCCNRAGFNSRVSMKGVISRKTMIGMCGCKARIVLKYLYATGYTLYEFREEHNHELATSEGKQFMRSNRVDNDVLTSFIFNASKVNIGATKAHSLYKEMVGGYANIGATSVDFKNINRNVKLYIGDNDAQMIIQKFESKRMICEGFFYKYDVDYEDRLTSLFWSDPVSRRNYDVFGDVVSFDATFRTNKYGMVFAPFTGVDNHKKSVIFAAVLLCKENITSYEWVFKTFLDCFGRQPLCIMTDQCPAMKQAIPNILTNSRHRLCMWHIMKKFPSKIGAAFPFLKEFISKINSYIWAEDITTSEFETGWITIIEEYQLTDNEWLSDLFANREAWIPAYFRDDPLLGMLRTTSRSESENSFFNQFLQKVDTLCEFYIGFESAMEKQRHITAKLNHEGLKSVPTIATPLLIEIDAAEVYTRAIFYDVQEEIKASCYQLIIDLLTEEAGMKQFTVCDRTAKKRKFQVIHNTNNNEVACSCKMFERKGIQCRHVFLAFNHGDITSIPRQYVMPRWMKHVEQFYSSISTAHVAQYNNAMNSTNILLNNIWFDCQSCVTLAGMDETKLEYIEKQLKEMKCFLKESQEVPSANKKKDMIESLVGSNEVDNEIFVKLPHEVRNKGCGKRLISGAEKSIGEQKKALRMCKLCHKLCNHDSRNCPEKRI